MISYAQHGEDVVLARALPKDDGFYVDVGAADPDVASVTRHFYELGWTGINIEPRNDAIERLKKARPRDINLQICAGSEDSREELFEILEDADLTTASPQNRDFLKSAGYSWRTQEVEVRTLDTVFTEHGVSSIDFLKVDVEGAEGEVLAGLDLRRWRPKVVVVEAVKPYSHIRTDEDWRHYLERAGYREALFDGLNLYFAPAEEQAVIANLYPASPADGFKPEYVRVLENEVARLRSHVRTLQKEMLIQDEHRIQVDAYVRSLESRLPPEALNPSPAAGADAGAARHRAAQPLRFAVIGTPRSGGSAVGRSLAETIGTPLISVEHPGDVMWQEMPESFVAELHWPRTKRLESVLEEQRAIIVGVGRHPLDTLCSLAELARESGSLVDSGGGDDAFLAWAQSSAVSRLLTITPGWWSSPATIRVRYEDFAEDPISSLRAVLEPIDGRFAGDLRAGEREADAEMGGAGRWRKELDDATAQRLREAYLSVFDVLGYDLTDAATATAATD